MADLTKADWTQTERWVWEQIAAGLPADLNARDRENSPDFEHLDPSKRERWGKDRRLRTEFLENILTQEAYTKITPYGGVRISGALIDDAPLNLEHARLERLFWLERARILQDVKCRNVRVDGGLSLKNSYISGGVELCEADIQESLSFAKAYICGDVNLDDVRIGSNLDMRDAIFESKLALNFAKVECSAYLSGYETTFNGEVQLGVANIGAVLDMRYSTFKGKTFLGSIHCCVLDMTRAAFKDDVILEAADVEIKAYLRAKELKGKVWLQDVRIGSVLDMSRAIYRGQVDLSGARIGSVLDMSHATFERDVGLAGATIDSDLDLRKANVWRMFDLTGSHVKGELRLGSDLESSASWQEGAKLVLRNASAGSIQDWWKNPSENSWPKTFELEGFTYHRLGGFYLAKEGVADMQSRSSKCYEEWLENNRFSPQPYEQLATVFRRRGEPVKANDILYAGRERRRRLAWSTVDECGRPKDREWASAAWLWLLKSTIGYGLGNRYFRALLWVAVLTLLGMIILIIATGRYQPESWALLFFASFDQLLPIITLNESHEKIVLRDIAQPNWVTAYFYLHKIIGWMLGSFIVAGLAGLTQRN